MKIVLVSGGICLALVSLTACTGSSTQVVTVTAPAPNASTTSSPAESATQDASEPVPFTFGDFGVVPMDMGSDYSVEGVVFIENPNADQYLYSGRYRITARDSTGAVVGNMENFIESVPPLGTIANFFPLETTSRDADFTFEFIDADWIESAEPADTYLALETKGVAVDEIFEDNYVVTGEVINPYDIRLERLLLTAVAFDSDRKPIGVGIDYPSGGAASGTVPFSIYTSATEKPDSVTVYAQPISGDNPWKDTAEGNPPPASSRTVTPSATKAASAAFSAAEACAFVDDMAFRLLFDGDYDTTAGDFRDAAVELEAAAPGIANAVLQQWYLDLAEASIINADEIDRRDNEGSDPFDFFFPTEAWDAAFNGKVYNACEAAGHKWGDN